MFNDNGERTPENDIDGFPITVNIHDIRQIIREIPDCLIRCRDCKYGTPLKAHADIENGLHCAIGRGEEVLNVWHKYSKHYEDYSLADEDGFCDQGERRVDK